MWCSITVLFAMLDDFNGFICGDFGDMDINHHDMSVTCYGNHRLLDDVHSWCQGTEGRVICEENFGGYDTTTAYEEGRMLYQHSVEEGIEV